MAKNKAALSIPPQVATALAPPAPVEVEQASSPPVRPAEKPAVCGNQRRCFKCTRPPHQVGPHHYFEDGRLIAAWN